jgi:ubiquinone/menaquinone biosynthesis C-methylase UbiE
MDDLTSRFQHDQFVLQVGAGTCRYLAAFTRGRSVYSVALDIFQAQLLECTGPVGARLQGDARILPFITDAFDALLAVMTTHQYGDVGRRRFLVEAFRVLTSGRYLLVKTCSHDDLARRYIESHFPSSLASNRKRYPSIPDLTREMQSVGFNTSAVEPRVTREQLSKREFLQKVMNGGNSTLDFLPRDEL